jgi:tetratricopeptide (TPR) repeat protein
MFLGREREIGALDQVLNAASSGNGGLRVLSGEPGIGKTRLADEVVARATAKGFRVSWGRAWETGGAPAYWPWIEALAPLARTEDELPPRVQALLGSSADPVPGEGMRADPARERFELFEGVSSFVRAYGRREPLLLVFDDLHIADIPSLELLCFVARGLRVSRIAVLGTYRDFEARRPPVADMLARIAREGEVLPLRPLSREEVAELVRHETKHADAALSAAIHQLTEGNPLFLRETIYAVNANKSEVPLDALDDILHDMGALGGVLALVRSRVAGAGDQTRAVLDAAAVLGREAGRSLLSAVTGQTPNETLAALEDATLRGLLVRRGPERWAFSHVLVREAFYRSLPPDQRCALHHSIVVAWGERARAGVASEPFLAALAHHAMAALPVGDPVVAVRSARRAAAHARTQLAYEEAVLLLERARAACDEHGLDDRERAEVAIALGWAATEAGRLERGRELFREAVTLALRTGDPMLFARAALGQGAEYVLAEIRTELVDGLRAALAALGDRDGQEERRLRARLLARLAAALTPSGTPEEPLGLARQALALAEGETDVRTRIDVDVGVGSALIDFAPPAERALVNERLLRDARTASDRVLELRALTRLACDYLERGDVARSDATIAARAELAESIGHPRYLWQTPLLRSMQAMPQGRFDACEAYIAEARALAAEAPDPNAQRVMEFHRFSMLLVAGRSDALRAQEASAQRTLLSLLGNEDLSVWLGAIVAARLGEKALAAATLRGIGKERMAARMFRVSLLEAAILADVREMCEPLYQSFDGSEDANACWGPFAFSCAPPISSTLGMAAFALGRADEGRGHCERAFSLASRTDAHAHLAWVHLAWGEGAGVHDELERAIELAERLDMPEIVARAKGALGREAAPGRSSKSAPSHAATLFALRRDGSEWVIDHAGRSFRLKDVRGLGMLSQLVSHPGREIHAVDLATEADAGAGEGAPDLGDAGAVIDLRAREAYRKRVVDLREELEQAEAWRDGARAERIRGELETLTQQIAAAVGLGGRERRAGSAGERARVTVQRRVREAIKKIAEKDAVLGRHLDVAVRTGTFCAYEPEGPKRGR